jgi:hypothetical protein
MVQQHSEPFLVLWRRRARNEKDPYECVELLALDLAGKLPAPTEVVQGVASGGVKIVEIGRFENRCIRGRVSLSAGAPRLGSRRKMAQEDISTEEELRKRLFHDDFQTG